MSRRQKSFLGLSAGGFHRLAYHEWGPAEAQRTVICVHGLSRNARDFDALAAALADAGRRVVCLDVVGRGQSGWLADPAGYGYVQYMADANALIARLDVDEVDWVGTSMGGLIGMMLAAQAGAPLRRLVINDVGPFIPKASLERIGDTLSQGESYPDLAAVEARLRRIHAPFGPLTDDQWRHLAEHSVRPAADGGLSLHYDPAIGQSLGEGPFEDVELWPVWDAIACPVLALRGAESDLLLTETAAEMTRRGPKARLVEVAGCGHAPALMEPDQIAPIRDFLVE